MGQAKNRGSFEHRQAQALELKRQQMEAARIKRETEFEAYKLTPEYAEEIKKREKLEKEMQDPFMARSRMRSLGLLAASMAMASASFRGRY